MKDTVFIVGSRDDYHVQAVAGALQREHDITARCINTREFPLTAHGSFRTHELPRRLYTGQDGTIDLQAVRSVWWRRWQPCELPPVYFEGNGTFTQCECEHFVQGLLWGTDCLWVNDPLSDVLASRKLVQIARAESAGLAVPRTLITNDPDAAEEFIRESPSRLIFKHTGSGSGRASKTSFVTAEIAQRLDSVVASPTTFQEYIEAVGDLRVIWLDGTLFPVFIDSQRGVAPEDCRFDLSVSHIPYKLPATVEVALTKLMVSFGLVYAAIDLRLGVNGVFYFLEINPSGQFAYLELKGRIPLVSEFAAVLAQGESRVFGKRYGVQAERLRFTGARK